MPDRPSLPLTGGCPCGAVRYEVSAFPLLLYACHCTNCQRQSGAAFALNMPVRTSAFRLTSGAPKAWRRPGTASWFCPECAGRIHGARETRPQSVNVRAGTLDDTTWLTPIAHLFTRSAQKWEIFAAETPCYEDLPDDWTVLTQEWKRIWGD